MRTVIPVRLVEPHTATGGGPDRPADGTPSRRLAEPAMGKSIRRCPAERRVRPALRKRALRRTLMCVLRATPRRLLSGRTSALRGSRMTDPTLVPRCSRSADPAAPVTPAPRNNTSWMSVATLSHLVRAGRRGLEYARSPAKDRGADHRAQTGTAPIWHERHAGDHSLTVKSRSAPPKETSND